MADGGLTTGLAIAGILATVASTAVAYEGAQQSAAAAKATGEYNQQVADNEAKTAQQQASADAALQRDKARRLAGGQNAAAAKAGASLDGTVDDVSFDSAVQSSLDELNVLYKGNVAANRYRNQGTMSSLEGNNAAVGQQQQAAGSLLSGMAKSSDRGYDMAKRYKM